MIDLFELKFYNEPLRLDKSDALALREKIGNFRRLTQTRKHLFLSFLTTFGLEANKNSIGLVTHSLTMDILFEKGWNAWTKVYFNGLPPSTAMIEPVVKRKYVAKA